MTETDPTLEAAKAQLRLAAQTQRSAVPQADRADAAKRAAAHFFDAVPLEPGQIVAAYWPVRDEIDCRPVLSRLMDAFQPVCLPVVLAEDRPLSLRLWEPGQPLYPSGFGTLAPIESAPEVEPDIVIVPLLGFDGMGTRLGYGQGYYDRTLAAMDQKPLLVGYAFAAQQLSHIPRAPHDVPLDILVTEDGAQRFGYS